MNRTYALTALITVPLLFAIPALVTAAPNEVENTDTNETFNGIQSAIDDLR
jgi:hypothetical protein